MIGKERLMERVKKGAALMDVECPGWEQRVSTKILDLGSERRCVLGQVYGSFTKGQGILRLGGWAGLDTHGFALPSLLEICFFFSLSALSASGIAGVLTSLMTFQFWLALIFAVIAIGGAVTGWLIVSFGKADRKTLRLFWIDEIERRLAPQPKQALRSETSVEIEEETFVAV